MGLAQQMGHSESSEGKVMSDSSDCLAFSISIRDLTFSISSLVTWLGTFEKKKFEILKISEYRNTYNHSN